MIKRGFSLLELVLVLGVGSAITFMKFQEMKSMQEQVLARTLGEQIRQIGNAVNEYVSIRYDKISTMENAAGTGADPGPRDCANDICEISYKTLINEGLLPVSYSGSNAFKSSYRIILRRDGNSPNYIINGLITTSKGWEENNNVRYDLLGKAMQSAGIDSDMSKNESTVNGYQGGWKEETDKYSNIHTKGLLAYRVGFNSALYSIYLRRDGTLPMTGDLNLGGKSINNVKDLKATGSIEAKSATLNNDLLVFGNSTMLGDITSLGSKVNIQNGELTIGPRAQTRLFANGDAYLGGYTRIQGDVDINGSANVGSTLRVNGSALIEDYIRTRSYVEAAGNISSGGSISASGNLNVTKDLYAGSLFSFGNVEAYGTTTSKYLKPTSTETEKSHCSPNGLISKDSEGGLLTCVSGVWKSPTPLAASGIFVTNSNKYYPCSFPNRATGTCSCSPGLTDLIINTTSSTQCSGGQNDHCTTSYTYFHACS
ncbi:TPA: shufflon system plasmid conjugative transfer pilus tip adhesin PilV [Klebsiella pneumoniae]|uniref:shufflon system plasmid conjugative transfer pilus tip adhesin PilV n=1 Tax=Klebsiella oxytoca TaxID=571 RepID=UPI001F1E2B63|nr:shufflon system plasmid conjugative transfer pilus tip adhesin PilV [Klebsiella oxytoca]UIM60842.1 shufflon system plasmid conjugative transfer pilus tip adhesin PilV [Klebsiella oxytoca]